MTPEHDIPEQSVAPLSEVSGERPALRRIVDVWTHRALLVNLVRRDLRVRYKGSALGFLWSLLSPAMYLVVFSIVFKEFLRVDIPVFGVFLLSGLLAWNLFAGGLGSAAVSLTDNRALVQKVWFPREILPVASVGAALVNLALQGLVLIIGLAVFRHAPDLAAAWLLVPALLVLVLFTIGLGLIVSALNVVLRDVQHLIEVTLTAWFWVSAIVYPYATVANRLGEQEWLTTLNPMIPIVLTFQRVFYNPGPDPAVLLDVGPGWYLARLAVVGAFSVVLVFVGLAVFARREPDFGDQL
ncbi:MAG: ABC transporter permease [Acidimicrobiales bacterium]